MGIASLVRVPGLVEDQSVRLVTLTFGLQEPISGGWTECQQVAFRLRIHT